MKKNKKIIGGISSVALVSAMTGCSSYELPPEPIDTACAEWEWEYDDGVYECEEAGSPYYGYYYHEGVYYKGKTELKSSSKYKKYKSSSSFKGSSSSKSGFGSSSKSYGG